MITSSMHGNLKFVILFPALSPLDSSSTTAGKDKVTGTAGSWDEAAGEIEFMLHGDFSGQGYKSKTLTTVYPVFWQRGSEKVVADVSPREGGSIKVLNKFGFVDVGWCDTVYPGLQRPRS